MKEALKDLARTRPVSDLVEIRVDGITGLNLQRLLRQPRPRVIVTNRRLSEGGRFRGSARRQAVLLSEALRCGAEFVDMEFSWGIRIVREFIANHPASKIILSHHNFRSTPKGLMHTYRSMRRMKAGVLKIATFAMDVCDSTKTFGILKRANSEGQRMVALCMGEKGEPSRILGGVMGSSFTFASLDSNRPTAPGQVSVTELHDVYRISGVNGRTLVFGLVGNPVSHSRGVYYHNDMFRRKKVNAVYLNFLVDDITRFVRSYRHILRGFSVTMPFKQEILALLNETRGPAARLGVVNTVVIRRGRLIGFNTDFTAIRGLLMSVPRIRGKKTVVLGTGGTAKTMAAAALELGAAVVVVGRTSSKAGKLADELGCASATFGGLLSSRADILMNGTSVGMQPTTDPDLVPTNFLHRDLTVFDAVYSPVQTRLLVRSRKKGCRVISGLDLFNAQASEQSRLFLNEIK